jgi:hypothetical protein
MFSIGMHIFNDDIYRITVAMKVETKSISSIAASLIWMRCDTSDNVLFYTELLIMWTFCPLISQSAIVSINDLTLILKFISHRDFKYIMTKGKMSTLSITLYKISSQLEYIILFYILIYLAITNWYIIQKATIRVGNYRFTGFSPKINI